VLFTRRLISRRMRVGLAQIRFREDVSNFIGPTSIVLDDLVSDMRHRVDSGSYVYLSAKGAALVLFQQTTYPISSSHSLDDSMRSVRSIEFVADLVDGFNFPSAAQGCRRLRAAYCGPLRAM
jgi:hypothetical protein